MAPHLPRLLVSVCSVAEAEAALLGGAAVIDIKDPSRGSLGMADPEVIEQIARHCVDKAPVSAALGELVEHDAAVEGCHGLTRVFEGKPCASGAAWSRGLDTSRGTLHGLTYMKLGLAKAPEDWRIVLADRIAQIGRSRFIAVAYADHVRAASPTVDAVLAWAIEHRVAGLLIDTAVKDGRGLMHWCDDAVLTTWIAAARKAGLLIALAGSLSPEDVERCAGLGPDLIAVRTAACEGGRTGQVAASRVAALRQRIALQISRLRNAKTPSCQDAKKKRDLQ